MLDVLDKCLIRSTDGGVKKFFDIEYSSCFTKELNGEKSGDENNGKFEEGTVVGLDKIKSDTYRVQFLLKTGFIQVEKDVPSRLPFLLPDKGWAVCTPTKIHNRVSRLQVLDKILFRVDGDLPKSRGSLRQRLDSAIFNDSDFNTNNLLFPPIPQVTREADTTSSSASSTVMDRRELKGKLMSHIVSSTVTTTPEKEELVMSSKMKRSIPGDFRSSVEAGRTGKHGLTDLNDSTVSASSNMTTDSELVPNVTICRPSSAQSYSTYSAVGTPPRSSGEGDVTSTRHTPHRSTSQSRAHNIDQSITPVQNMDQSQWFLSRYAASLDRTPTNQPTPPRYLNRTDTELTPVNHDATVINRDLTPVNHDVTIVNRDLTPVNWALTPVSHNITVHNNTILHTPIRRRVISRPAVSTVTVSKTVSIPTSSVEEVRGEERKEEERGGEETELSIEEQGSLPVSESTESINVTDD